MKVGIDSDCYRRFLSEVYPDQKESAKRMTMISLPMRSFNCCLRSTQSILG